MVSPRTVFTYPFHHAKLQILLHGVTANSLYLSFSPCKATNLTTWCHREQSLLILFTMQSYKSYCMVSPQTVFTYPFHHVKLQILLIFFYTYISACWGDTINKHCSTVLEGIEYLFCILLVNNCPQNLLRSGWHYILDRTKPWILKLNCTQKHGSWIGGGRPHNPPRSNQSSQPCAVPTRAKKTPLRVATK